MGMIPVLLLDDNAEFRAMVADEVRAAGFDPTEAATVAEAEALVLRGIVRFEALLLDVSLPDGDGCDLCARLRAARQRMPVLMLAGSDAEDDVVRGLDAGLDDYLVKPVRASVLIARLLVTTRVGYRLAAPTEGGEGARGSPPTPFGPYPLQKVHLASPYQQAASAGCLLDASPA